MTESRSTRIPASDRQKEIYYGNEISWGCSSSEAATEASTPGLTAQTNKHKNSNPQVKYTIFFSKQLYSNDSSTAMYTKCLHENSIHTVSLIPTVIRFWFCLAFGNIASHLFQVHPNFFIGIGWNWFCVTNLVSQGKRSVSLRNLLLPLSDCIVLFLYTPFHR